MMTIEEKQKIFISEYSLYGWTIVDAYKILCLLGLLYKGLHKKDPNITVFEILNKIKPNEKNQYGRMYETLQFHVMSHLYQSAEKFPSFGLKSGADIKNEVKRLLEEWIPF